MPPTASTTSTTDPTNKTFQPLMTLYLTDKTSPDEIAKAATLMNDDGVTRTIVGCKYYPAGATTNSDLGVSDVKNLYPVLEAMQEYGMMLCIHSEVTHADIFEREPVFIEEIMKPLVAAFPKLKITMEHISTLEAVDYVLSAPDNVKASITPQHLMYNRNRTWKSVDGNAGVLCRYTIMPSLTRYSFVSIVLLLLLLLYCYYIRTDMLVGGIRPHLYCLPILKAEVHRQALVAAAISGNPKFFLGTDSAPHATITKEAPCGCAGIFSAHAAVELYTEIFDTHGKLDRLEDFASSFGADHYGIPRSTETITLERKSWTVPNTYEFGPHTTVTPLKAGEEIHWTIVGLDR
jgi:dihydroorotase